MRLAVFISCRRVLHRWHSATSLFSVQALRRIAVDKQKQIMDVVINSTVFSFIDPPNVRIQKPQWMQLPSPMTVFAFSLVTYFIVTGGVIYDVINEPPSVGSVTDERGHQRPQAILPHRINGQYIMEGLAASFMFTLGGLGFIVLDKCNDPLTPRKNRIVLLIFAFVSIAISFITIRTFMRIKMPGYIM